MTVQLRRCPLLDIARRYPEVVCQVHRGLIEGALTQLGGHDAGVDLQPFADPDACRLILPHAGEPAAPSPPDSMHPRARKAPPQPFPCGGCAE